MEIKEKLLELKEKLKAPKGEIMLLNTGFVWNDEDRESWYGSAYKVVALNLIEYLLEGE